MASQEKMEQLQQQQQARHRGHRDGRGQRSNAEQGEGRRQGEAGYDPLKDPAEIARQERNRRDEEEARKKEQENPNFKGDGRGGFAPDNKRGVASTLAKPGLEMRPKGPQFSPEVDIHKLEVLINQLSEICSDSELLLTVIEDADYGDQVDTKERLALESKTQAIKKKLEEIQKNLFTAGAFEERFARRELKAETRKMLHLVSLNNLTFTPETETSIALDRVKQFVKETPPYESSGAPRIQSIEQAQASSPVVLRPETNTARIPDAGMEQIKYENPVVKKLWNALYKQQDTPQALIAWHREYVLGGGMDTYRKNNTETQLSEEKVAVLKETLSILAENFREIYEIENRPELYKGETNEGLPTGWGDFKSSRRGEYLLYAELLSGNINPKSPYGESIQKWSVADFEKELERIKTVPDNLKPLFEKARTQAPMTSTSAVTGTVTPEPVVAVEPTPLATPDTSTEPIKLSTDKYNEAVAQLLEEHLTGKIITKEQLIGKGFTKEQADDFMQLIK